MIIFTPQKNVKISVLEVLFGAKNSFLYLLGCIVLAAGITLIIYFRSRDVKVLSKWQARGLFGLRFFSVLILAVLLLSPLIKFIKRYVNNPVIITAFDNSSSLLAAGDSVQIKKELTGINDRLQAELKGKYSVVSYTFGEKARTNHALNFDEKKSDYSNLINTVYNNHFNENVGALIIVGDGIYNMGSNPVTEVQKLNFPVYCIGIGDTNVVRDAAITNIMVNRNAFAGNMFPVEINMRFEKMANQPVDISVEKKGKVVYTRRVVPANDDYFTTDDFSLKADSSGLQRYLVRLNTPAEERNKRNNHSDFVINVLKNKQKVLILSEGPHPDLGAIREALEGQQNFDVTLFTGEPYPGNFNNFNLIILNQLPSTGTASSSLINKCLESKTPLLFLVGARTYLPQMNQLNLGIRFIPQASTPEDAQPVVNHNFEIFRMNNELTEMLEKFPPLQVPFAEINLDPAYSVMLYQNLNKINTQRPLVAMGKMDERKIGVIFGEGIWRWRLYNYFYNQSNQQFDDFVVSMVRYLSLRENEENFIVDCKPVFYETDPVVLRAEVYDESFNLITDPEVSIGISDENGNNYPFVFDRDSDFYKLDAGELPVGNYNYKAKVKVGDEEFTKSGNFTIMPLEIENVDTRANFNTLFQMSNLTGGEFFNASQLPGLANTIANNRKIKPTTYFQASITELLNQKWLFIILILLFGMEWFLRKYWGIY